MGFWNFIFGREPRQPVPVPIRLENLQPQRPMMKPVEMLPVFYCNNDDCTRSIDAIDDASEILYGCPACKREMMVPYGELPDESRAKFTPDPASLAKSGVQCKVHHLPLVALCPDCKKPLGRDSATPPIGIWGAPSSGKTVFCASMVKELNERLYGMCGINPRFGMDLRGYRRQVVTPLWERGLVPAKTGAGEHRGIVIYLRQGQNAARKFKMTDMDGAYYTEFFTSGGSQEAGNEFTRLIHFTREAMFLVSPDQAGAVGADAQAELYTVVSALVERWEDLRLLAGYDVDRLQRLMNAAIEKLRVHQYPSQDDIHAGFKPLACDLLTLLDRSDPKSIDATDKVLQKVAASTTGDHVLSMEDQLSGLEMQLRNWSFKETPDGKLDLRLAVTITKADLLMGQARLLHNPAELMPTVSNPNNRNEWRSAVRQASSRARAILMERHPTVVSLAEESFRDVGYFFASALGRDTQLLAVEAAQRSQVVDMDSEAGPNDRGIGGRRFEVRKRIPIGADGSRRPNPFGVLNPLLWLLMGE